MLEKICKAIMNPKKQVKSCTLLTQLIQAQLTEAQAPLFYEALTRLMDQGLIQDQLLADNNAREACIGLFTALKEKTSVFQASEQVGDSRRSR